MTFDPGHPALFRFQQADYDRREAARERASRGHPEACTEAEAAVRLREAYEAFQALLRLRGESLDDDGPAVGYGVRDGVPRTRNDRRRRGRLPHEDDPGFDDVVRLFDR